MNYMEQVARILGVELGEQFKIDGIKEIFYIDEEGLKQEYGDNFCFNNGLVWLLNGNAKVVKFPWKPKHNDECYYVAPNGSIVSQIFYTTYSDNLLFYKLGKLYRTREEAEAHIDEDIAFWEGIRKELEE